MKCRKCQFENPDGIKFCGGCGAKLDIVCPDCGRSNPPNFRFCSECAHDLRKPEAAPPIDHSKPQAYTPKFLAEKILQSRSALEGERKQVTVLFVDLKGSMDLAEQVDPGEWHGILGLVQAIDANLSPGIRIGPGVQASRNPLTPAFRVCINTHIDSRTIVEILRREGWQEVHRVGSHVQFRHPSRKGRVTVPHPKRDIPLGTLRSIERQSGGKFT